MSMTWQEFEEDLLRREPQPQTLPVRRVKIEPWNWWDRTFAALTLCALIAFLVVWIGDYSV